MPMSAAPVAELGSRSLCPRPFRKRPEAVWATQTVPLADLFNQPVHGAAWKKKPTWYIVGKNDQTVHPDLERFLAKRMNAKITELETSHVPMLVGASGASMR